jgi:hypothetical protein
MALRKCVRNVHEGAFQVLDLREFPQLDFFGRLVVSDGENVELCTIHLDRKFCPELSRLQRVIEPVCRNENAFHMVPQFSLPLESCRRAPPSYISALNWISA